MSSTSIKIDELKIFEFDAFAVTVKDDRPRQRKELGEIKKLAESITKYGQFQPIVIDRDGALVAGGRRLAACLLLGRKVRACYKDSIDPVLLREIELEENIQRKSLTPAEESLAVAELVKLKQAQYGVPVQGREGGFTLTDIAELIGKTKGSVIEDLKIAEAVGMFPTLVDCKTKSDIKKAVKGYERIQQNVAALKTYTEIIKKSDNVILANLKAEDYLKDIPDESIDLFFTDPPYGIDIGDVGMTIGGATGGEHTTAGTSYEDSEEVAKELLFHLVPQSYRITKDTGHAYIFCAPSHFWWLKEFMEAAGWLVAPRPIVWIKRETGQNNQPEKWFSAAYEFILFARKPNSSLTLQGRPDWIQCDIVPSSQRVHQAEKPVQLCKELISRTCMPGQYMLDPCMGSGALIEAGAQMKLLVMGCEKDPLIYADAVARMAKKKEGV